MPVSTVGPKPGRAKQVSSIAMAMHDLKGYLAIISGQARLLRGGKLGPVTEQQLEALTDIVAGCRQIEEQIVRLLNPEARAGSECDWTPVLKKIDLRKCLLDAHSLMRPEFADAQITFEVQPWDCPLRVPYDARLIRRVLLNLLENARRFTPAGGSVKMMVSPEFWERRNLKFRAAFSATRSKPNAPNCAKVVVADTGCGIAPEVQETIFKEYFSTPAPDAPPSSGLGLAISRKIIEAHGGMIWVESTPGEGSRFCFYLPFVAPTEGVFYQEEEDEQP
jgi:signal transduction histidine kinase